MAVLENEVVRLVEERYGSLEAFAVFILEEHPDLFTPKYTPKHREKITGIPAKHLLTLKGSLQFRRLISSEIIQREFGIETEIEHVRVVVAKSTDPLADVKDIIAAGRYLEERRGTPLGVNERQVLPMIQINTGPQLYWYGDGDAQAQALDGPSIRGLPPSRHKPKVFGDEPPDAVKNRVLVSGTQDSRPFALPESEEEPVSSGPIGDAFGGQEDVSEAAARVPEDAETSPTVARLKPKLRRQLRRVESYQRESVGFGAEELVVGSSPAKPKD